jgi:hypothetical protein
MFRAIGTVLVLLFAVSPARADVVTAVSGTQLTVTGDSSPNDVDVGSAPDGGVTVTGRNGTLVDGSANGVTVPGVLRLVVKLGKGSDYLMVTNVDFPDGLNIRMGNGNDTVILDGVTGGLASIRTGYGDDAVGVFYPTRLKQLGVNTSTGWDSVFVQGAWITGDLDVDTGSGCDAVSITGTEVDYDMNVELGNDDDYVELVDVAVGDDVELDGQNGDNFVVFAGYIWIGDDLDLDGFDDGFF